MRSLLLIWLMNEIIKTKAANHETYKQQKGNVIPIVTSSQTILVLT